MVGVDPFVISERGASVSFGVGIFCNASMVDDGGVFSPKMGFNGGRVDRKVGVSRPPSRLLGGVPDLVGLLSGDRFMESSPSIRGRRSGERSWDLSRELSAFAKLFRSRVESFCHDCRRL